jgi:hypothetical protein
MSKKKLFYFKNNLSKLRKKIFKDYREENLSKIICSQMEKYGDFNEKKVIKILDYGSGHNPILIKKIIKRLKTKYKKKKFLAYCYDFYNKNELKKMNNSYDIKFFKIETLQKKESLKFNFCLIIDVLHHIGIKETNKISKIIKLLKKKSKILIIKDHFQYGFFSNLSLILMDFVGNYGDNVKIPSIYFNIKTYDKFMSKLNLKEIKRINDKKYYRWYWFYFNSKKLQFISILK